MQTTAISFPIKFNSTLEDINQEFNQIKALSVMEVEIIYFQTNQAKEKSAK